jgi:hypothetical protein
LPDVPGQGAAGAKPVHGWSGALSSKEACEMDPAIASDELKLAKRRIADLETTLRAEQARLSRAQARVEILERALRGAWGRVGAVQGRR